MDEFDSGLSINITEVRSFAKTRKKKRFFGNKNYRNQTRHKYLGKNKRPKIINTSKVTIADRKSVEDEGREDDDDTKLKLGGGSTALHFNAVGSILKEKPTDVRNKRLRQGGRAFAAPKAKIPKTDEASKLASDASILKIQPKPGISGPWKSSLFNQNPEIPKIVQPDVSRIQEKVFSGQKFSDLDIHSHLLSYINEKLKLSNMTAIQQKAIPLLLSGKDALIKSQTGSGKTLAYAIPIVQKLQAMKPNISRKDGPLAMVLTPTRELSLQSYKIFSKLNMPFCRIVPTWIIGGENRKSEKSRIRKGVNILIGTPGRALDHIQTTTSLSLKNLRWLVFDEADRLLDMGFQKQIDAILSAIKEQSEQELQTVLLSATLSEKVERLASLALENPAHIHVSNSQINSAPCDEEDTDENYALPQNLMQHVAVIPSKLRLVSLVLFLKSQSSERKILVFLSCRDSVEFHYHLFRHILRRPKISAQFDLPFDVDLAETEFEEADVFELHGGMSQNERRDVFHTFSSAEHGVLLTTDVAARGLDMPSVDWVIQYTSPGSPVDYIHRVGRTARAGNKGNALLMLTPAEVKYVNLLTQFNISVQQKSVDDMLCAGRGATDRVKKKPEAWKRLVDLAKSDATALQNQIESYLSRNVKIKTLARTAYMSFIRAYATYPSELKSIFHVKHLHLGHVAKSFGLQDAPKDIVKTLQKSVGHLPVRTSFEYREAKKEAAEKEKTPTESEKEDDAKPKVENRQVVKSQDRPPRLSRKQIMRNKMSRRPDLMSEFSSGLDGTAVPLKKAKR